MEDQIVNLIITVHRMTPIFRLFFFEEFKHFVKVWYRAHGFVCLDVYCFCLCIANRGERGYLAVIEPCGLAKAF